MLIDLIHVETSANIDSLGIREVVHPRECPAHPVDQVVSEDLQVAPPRVCADVSVAGGVLHGAVVRPAGVTLVLQVDAVASVPELDKIMVR